MAYKVITTCPICSKKLRSIKLKCTGCNTVIENEFEFSKFEYLSKEQLYFIETFLKCRGNIKDVEKEMGISYPTVRAKLDEVLNALGYVQAQEQPKKVVDNKAIIEALEKGEISAEEAIKKLND